MGFSLGFSVAMLLSQWAQKSWLWRELCICKIGSVETHGTQDFNLPGRWSFPETEMVLLASKDT